MLLIGGMCEGVFFVLIVFVDVILDMNVYWEELFGLVVVVYCVVDEDVVVVLVNDIMFGFGLYVFMMDVD